MFDALNERSGKRASIEDIRRAEFVAATVRTIAERGFAGTTVRDIARAAGASPASVIYYFRTKDDLLAVAFADSDARFRARIRNETADLEGLAKLRRIVDLCFADDALDDPAWRVEFDLWGLAARREDFREIFEAANAEWTAILAAGVREAVPHATEGEVRQAAQSLSAHIDGLAVHARVTKHMDAKAALAILHRQLELIVPGGSGTDGADQGGEDA